MTRSDRLSFEGLLFFPVTPFDESGRVESRILAEHVSSRLGYAPGAVFAACGTGEFHALSAEEVATVVRVTVETVAGRVPVVAGAGGPLGHALACARAAAEAGADALLVLPPYLVEGTADGLVAYVEAVVQAAGLPAVVYQRATAKFTQAALLRLAAHPLVVGFKDGTGDIGRTQEFVRAVRAAGHEDFAFFNGLLTAELTQAAYRGIGVPFYSSAAFAMAPEVATAFHAAYVGGDEERRLEILDRFYLPLVRLRDETPGFGVALIKAGLRLGGLPVGPVRAPLVDPDARQTKELERILEIGVSLVRQEALA